MQFNYRLEVEFANESFKWFTQWTITDDVVANFRSVLLDIRDGAQRKLVALYLDEASHGNDPQRVCPGAGSGLKRKFLQVKSHWQQTELLFRTAQLYYPASREFAVHGEQVG